MDKYKKLMSNTVIFGIGSLGTKLLGFLLVALYSRVMTDAEYSTADLLYNTVNMLVPLVTFSMADAVIRFGMDKEYDCRKVYTCANVCVLAGMAVFMLFTPLTASNKIIGEYSFLLYIYCYLSCFRQIASQFVRARGYTKFYAVDGIIACLVQLVCNLIFLLGFKMGVTGYVLSIVVGDAVSLLMLTGLARLDKCLDARFFDKDIAKQMLKYSAPLIPTYLMWWVTSASDRWFVIGMVGEDANGVYSMAYKLPTLLMLVTTMFYQAWQMSSIEERDSRTLGKFYENVFSAYSSLIFIGAAGLIMLCRPLSAILLGGSGETDFSQAYLYSPVLVLAMIFQCLCQFLSSIYSTKKRSVNSCVTSVVAAVVNIILNFVLIPKYSVWGAAIATASAYFACFAVRIFDARKYIFFKVNYMKIIVNTAIIIGMCVLTAKQPKLMWLGIIACFIVVLVYNAEAIFRTLRQIFTRGRRRNGAARRNGNAAR